MVGSRLDFVEGTDLLVYPTNRAAYARLTRLLSVGKRRAGKAKCKIDWADVADWSAGLIPVLVPDEAGETTATVLRQTRGILRTVPIGPGVAARDIYIPDCTSTRSS